MNPVDAEVHMTRIHIKQVSRNANSKDPMISAKIISHTRIIFILSINYQYVMPLLQAYKMRYAKSYMTMANTN